MFFEYSMFSLVAMAFDRYKAINNPLNSYDWTTKHGLMQMICVWSLSILLATPQAFIFRNSYHPYLKAETCLAKFPGPDRTWELFYIFWTIIAQFLLPVIILSVCYISIYLIISRNLSNYARTENFPNSQTNRFLASVHRNLGLRTSNYVSSVSLSNSSFLYRTPSSKRVDYPKQRKLSTSFDSNQSFRKNSTQSFVTNNRMNKARLKTIKITFIVVLTYILCSTPFYIGSIIMTLNGKFLSQKAMSRLNHIQFRLLL